MHRSSPYGGSLQLYSKTIGFVIIQMAFFELQTLTLNMPDIVEIKLLIKLDGIWLCNNTLPVGFHISSEGFNTVIGQRQFTEYK